MISYWPAPQRKEILYNSGKEHAGFKPGTLTKKMNALSKSHSLFGKVLKDGLHGDQSEDDAINPFNVSLE